MDPDPASDCCDVMPNPDPIPDQGQEPDSKIPYKKKMYIIVMIIGHFMINL